MQHTQQQQGISAAIISRATHCFDRRKTAEAIAGRICWYLSAFTKENKSFCSMEMPGCCIFIDYLQFCIIYIR